MKEKDEQTENGVGRDVQEDECMTSKASTELKVSTWHAYMVDPISSSHMPIMFQEIYCSYVHLPHSSNKEDSTSIH
ncbi:unnamed protein product [Sphenostylis stenocarpa]|uniref:Uncharacterized protein n=1 Tax=Sphenostylis stenocarpa TaxID=92480 RepID=A0AA86VK28_9FABA|nr:unnamed protein product [Sphenostylis stenocarpa]